MSVNPWKVSQDIIEMIRDVQSRHHSPRLAQASIAACFEDSKPFVDNKINLGKVVKSTPFSKLWQGTPHDFCIVVPADLWVSVLNAETREAYIDLQLTRCEVEYEAEVVEVVKNGKPKKQKVKDEWGRVQYTDVMKVDDVTGDPKWKVLKPGLEVFTKNVRRYGPWLDELLELRDAIDKAPAAPAQLDKDAQ